MTTQTLNLPSGAVATLRAGFGADLVQARKMLGAIDGAQPDDLSFAILTLLLKVDGQELDLDGVKSLDMYDGLTIAEAAKLAPEVSPDTLPSGGTYALRKAKFGDLQAAQRLVDERCDLDLCLIAVLATFDGERLPPDELAAMDLTDVLMLTKVVEGLGPTRAPSRSPS